MSSIYEPTDNITPMVSFNKSIAVDGGIVAKSASLGNSQCKLVVNDRGIYIVIPSSFDNDGNVSEPNYRQYDLGAIIESIQELNRRTAWMETDMTFHESLKETDTIEDNTANPGAYYSNVTDLLPGLKRTVPDGVYFRLFDTNDRIISIYQILDTDVPDDGSLTASHIVKLRKLMGDNNEYINKYISPRLLNESDTSFDILVLDTVNDSSDLPTLSDKYYIYSPIGDGSYKASLKDGVTINDICTDGNRIIPPVPYICTFSNENTQLDVTSIAGLFKGQIKGAVTFDFSDWDFSRITDMSDMFSDCSTEFHVRWTNESAALPGFIRIWNKSPYYVVLDDGELVGIRDADQVKITINGLKLSNYIWKGENDQWFRFGSTKAGENDTFGIIKLG